MFDKERRTNAFRTRKRKRRPLAPFRAEHSSLAERPPVAHTQDHRHQIPSPPTSLTYHRPSARARAPTRRPHACPSPALAAPPNESLPSRPALPDLPAHDMARAHFLGLRKGAVPSNASSDARSSLERHKAAEHSAYSPKPETHAATRPEQATSADAPCPTRRTSPASDARGDARASRPNENASGFSPHRVQHKAPLLRIDRLSRPPLLSSVSALLSPRNRKSQIADRKSQTATASVSGPAPPPSYYGSSRRSCTQPDSVDPTRTRIAIAIAQNSRRQRAPSRPHPRLPALPRLPISHKTPATRHSVDHASTRPNARIPPRIHTRTTHHNPARTANLTRPEGSHTAAPNRHTVRARHVLGDARAHTQVAWLVTTAGALVHARAHTLPHTPSLRYSSRSTVSSLFLLSSFLSSLSSNAQICATALRFVHSLLTAVPDASVAGLASTSSARSPTRPRPLHPALFSPSAPTGTPASDPRALRCAASRRSHVQRNPRPRRTHGPLKPRVASLSRTRIPPGPSPPRTPGPRAADEVNTFYNDQHRQIGPALVSNRPSTPHPRTGVLSMRLGRLCVLPSNSSQSRVPGPSQRAKSANELRACIR
ncbi:hypothetical protein DFH11DRAFT_1724642 [Phellopilus nigrolimitatus]|nr:hypothetical protein DFH11DRAFT_1724642 [Phellopilus nigrolimitatus]